MAFCNEVFENLYYVPVEMRTFRNITILITAVGNPIAFPDKQDTCDGRFTLSKRSPVTVYKHVTAVLFVHSELWIHLYGTIYIKRDAVTLVSG